MSVRHKDLASGRWHQFPFLVQMAHIAGEVERALKWKELGNWAHRMSAYERALELLEMTTGDVQNRSRVKELTRVREALVDYFGGTNAFGSSDTAWRKYFGAFTYAARRHC